MRHKTEGEDQVYAMKMLRKDSQRVVCNLFHGCALKKGSSFEDVLDD